MKKATLTIILILVLTLSLQAAELNPSAQVLKENMTAGYIVIKSIAILEWPNDPSMQLFEINKQCEAAFDLFLIAGDFEKVDVDLYFAALQKWSYDNSADENFNHMVEWFNTMMKDDPSILSTFFEMPVDWNMMKYEYEKQLKAKAAF